MHMIHIVQPDLKSFLCLPPYISLLHTELKPTEYNIWLDFMALCWL